MFSVKNRLFTFPAIDIYELRISASAFSTTANRIVRVGAFSSTSLSAFTDDKFLNLFHLEHDSQGRPNLPVIVDQRLEVQLEADIIRLEHIAADVAVVCDQFRCRYFMQY
jgi:hypothetical protein